MIDEAGQTDMMQLSLTNDREPGEESYIEDGWIRAAQHNIAAFEPLYLRYRERIYGYLRTRLKSDEDATDLTQQVFLQAMHALPRYKSRGIPFAVWLFRIVRNEYY